MGEIGVCAGASRIGSGEWGGKKGKTLAPGEKGGGSRLGGGWAPSPSEKKKKREKDRKKGEGGAPLKKAHDGIFEKRKCVSVLSTGGRSKRGVEGPDDGVRSSRLVGGKKKRKGTSTPLCTCGGGGIGGESRVAIASLGGAVDGDRGKKKKKKKKGGSGLIIGKGRGGERAADKENIPLPRRGEKGGKKKACDAVEKKERKKSGEKP